MNYTIHFSDGRRKTATSMNQAIDITRRELGVERIYRGARYVTDEPAGEDRRVVEALDLWTTRADAMQVRDVPARAVVTW